MAKPYAATLKNAAQFGTHMRAEIGRDYWEKAGDLWIRWHVTNRKILFKPQTPWNDQAGPNPAHVKSERLTFAAGVRNVAKDNWRNPKVR